MHAGAFGFDFFFLFDAEAVFLVNNYQTQIFKGNILGQQAVRADDNVAHAVFNLLDNFALLGFCLEAAEHLHVYGKARHALGESFVMLVGQNGGGHQHHYLFAAHDCVQGRAHGYFGFAKAHIADQDAVHGFVARKVAQDVLYGLRLPRGLHIRERVGKFFFYARVAGQGFPAGGLAQGFHAQNFFGGFLRFFFDAFFDVFPRHAAQGRQSRRLAARADVFLHAFKVIHGHI